MIKLTPAFLSGRKFTICSVMTQRFVSVHYRKRYRLFFPEIANVAGGLFVTLLCALVLKTKLRSEKLISHGCRGLLFNRSDACIIICNNILLNKKLRDP